MTDILQADPIVYTIIICVRTKEREKNKIILVQIYFLISMLLKFISVVEIWANSNVKTHVVLHDV